MFDLSKLENRDCFLNSRWQHFAALAYGCYSKWGRGTVMVNLRERPYSATYAPEPLVEHFLAGDEKFIGQIRQYTSTYDPRREIVCLMAFEAGGKNTVSTGVYEVDDSTPEM